MKHGSHAAVVYSTRSKGSAYSRDQLYTLQVAGSMESRGPHEAAFTSQEQGFTIHMRQAMRGWSTHR